MLKALFLTTMEDAKHFQKVEKHFALFKRSYQSTVALEVLLLNDLTQANLQQVKHAIANAEIVVGITSPTFFLHMINAPQIFDLLEQRRNQGKVLASIILIEDASAERLSQPFKGLRPLNYNAKAIIAPNRNVDHAMGEEKVIELFTKLVEAVLNPPQPPQPKAYYVPSPSPSKLAPPNLPSVQKQKVIHCPRCLSLSRSQTYCTNCGHVFVAPSPARLPQAPVAPVYTPPSPPAPKQQQQQPIAQPVVQTAKVLVLYSRKDQSYADNCIQALENRRLLVEDLYRPYVGGYTEEVVQKKVDISKKVILLISADCLAEIFSGRETELVLAYHKLTSGQQSNLEVVVVRPCYYEGILQPGQKSYPPGGKAVSQVANKDQLWTDFAKYLASKL